MRRRLAALGLLTIAACSDSTPASPEADSGGVVGCPDDLPATCPTPPPTYAKDIAPLIQSSCATCHSPGGRESGRLLTTYDQVFSQRGAVLNQVNACRMPPRGGPQISAEGRKNLLGWLVCGAKND